MNYIKLGFWGFIFQLFFLSFLFANPIENSYYFDNAKNMWSLDQAANFPDSMVVGFDKILSISKDLLDSMASQLNAKFKRSGEDIYQWRGDGTFVLEGKTNVLGLPFDTEHCDHMSVVLVDSNGKVIKSSMKEYQCALNVVAFQGKVYLDSGCLSNNETSSPKQWKLLISQKEEAYDTLPYEIAYYEMMQALIDHKIIKPKTALLPASCFFRSDKSYYYDSDKRSLYIYDKSQKKLTTFQIPIDNPIVKKAMIETEWGRPGFQGVSGNFIVFSDMYSFSTILVDMKSTKCYVFSIENICKRFDVTDVYSWREEYDFASGYNLFVAENNLYYFVSTKPGDCHVIRCKLTF